MGEDTYYLTYGTQTITLEDYQKLSGQQTNTPQEIPQEPTTNGGETAGSTVVQGGQGTGTEIGQ